MVAKRHLRLCHCSLSTKFDNGKSSQPRRLRRFGRTAPHRPTHQVRQILHLLSNQASRTRIAPVTIDGVNRSEVPFNRALGGPLIVALYVRKAATQPFTNTAHRRLFSSNTNNLKGRFDMNRVWKCCIQLVL
jgi:hypothetical protein